MALLDYLEDEEPQYQPPADFAANNDYKNQPEAVRNALKKRARDEGEAKIAEILGEKPDAHPSSNLIRAWNNKEKTVRSQFETAYNEAFPKIAAQTTAEKVYDAGNSFLSGVNSLGKSVASQVFGYDSSQKKYFDENLKSSEESLSPEYKRQQQFDKQKRDAEIQAIDAENKGGAFNDYVAQVKKFAVGAKRFGDDPVNSLASGAGSLTAVVPAAVGAYFGGVPALIGTGTSLALGAAAGFGESTSSRADAFKDRALKAGMSKEAAEKIALEASKITEKTVLGDTLSAGFGMLDTVTGAAGAARRLVTKQAAGQIAKNTADGIGKATVKTGLSEGFGETGQGLASDINTNKALNDYGFKTDLLDGVLDKAGTNFVSGLAIGSPLGAAAQYRQNNATTAPDLTKFDTEAFNASMKDAPIAKAPRQQIANKAAEAIASGKILDPNSQAGRIQANYLAAVKAKGTQNDDTGTGSRTLDGTTESVQTTDYYGADGSPTVLSDLLNQADGIERGDTASPTTGIFETAAARVDGRTVDTTDGGVTDQTQESITATGSTGATTGAGEQRQRDIIAAANTDATATGGSAQSQGTVSLESLAKYIPNETQAAANLRIKQAVDAGYSIDEVAQAQAESYKATQNPDADTVKFAAQTKAAYIGNDFIRPTAAQIQAVTENGKPAFTESESQMLAGNRMGLSEPIWDKAVTELRKKYESITGKPALTGANNGETKEALAVPVTGSPSIRATDSVGAVDGDKGQVNANPPITDNPAVPDSVSPAVSNGDTFLDTNLQPNAVSGATIQDGAAVVQPEAKANLAPIPATSPEIRAEQKRQQDIKRSRVAKLKGYTYAKSPFLAFLGGHGVTFDLKREFSPDKNPILSGYGMLFRRNGLSLDALTEQAVQDGFLPPNTNDDAAIYELINRQMRGESIAPLYTEDGATDAMQAEIDKRAEFEEDAAFEELSQTTYTTAELDALEDIPWDTPADSSIKETTRQAMEAMGFSEQEIQDEIAREQRITQKTSQSSNSASQAEASQPREGAATPTGQAEPEALVLQPTTPEGDRANAARVAEAEKAKSAADKAADVADKKASDQKEIDARQNASADNFQLGQSAEDSLSGQGGLNFAKIGETSNKNGQSYDARENKPAVDKLSTIIAANFNASQPEGSSAFVPVSLPEQRSLGIIAEAFGKSAVGFKLNSLLDAKTSAFTGIGGVSVGAIPNTVFINATNSRPHLSILGHELAHELARDNKPLYNEFVNAIRAYVKSDFYNKNFPKEAVARHLTEADAIREEFIGEVLSDGFTEPAFWSALDEKNPTLAKKVYGYVADLIAKIKVAFGSQRRTEKYLDDFDAVMKIAGRVMAKYGLSSQASTDGGVKFSRTTDTPFDGIEQARTPLGDTKTVTVNGKEYSVFNSDGKPIHGTVEGVRNFVRWFGDSKVTDNGKAMNEGGKPINAGHFTDEDNNFNTFDKSTIGSANRFTTLDGFYFGKFKEGFTVSNKRLIGGYLKISNPIIIDVGNSSMDSIDAQAAANGVLNDRGDAEMRSYLEDFEGMSEEEANQQIADWRNADGVILKNTKYDAHTEEYIVFNSNQIKSSAGNVGDFDPANPDITQSQTTTTTPTGNTASKIREAFKAYFGKDANEKLKQVFVVGSAKDVPEGALKSITAYHGSPYRFNKFSLEHLGKGEGAQAYGYGLYFADSKDVAEHYKGTLQTSPRLRMLLDEVGKPDVSKLKQLAEKKLKTDPTYQAVIEELVNFDEGALYRVNIKPDEDTFLLWDKPLSEQPQKVRDALETLLKKYDDIYLQTKGKDGWKDVPLRDIYVSLSAERRLGSPKDASVTLQKLGINGTKYLDGTSRNSGKGSYNYVVFDDAAVEIVETFYSKSDDNAQAFYNPKTGDIYLIADKIKQGEEIAVLLHEIGHKRLPQAIGTVGMRQLRKGVDAWKDAPEGSNERIVFEAADARAKADGNYDAEIITYAIEEAENRRIEPNALAPQGTVAKWLASVKAAFSKAVAKLFTGDVPKLTTSDLLDIAKGAAGLELENAPIGIDAKDAEYLAAVERGDMSTAQRMVDDAAEAAGYSDTVYHGTNNEFYEFDFGKQGKNGQALGSGFYTTNSKDVASGYGSKTLKLFQKKSVNAFSNNQKTITKKEVLDIIQEIEKKDEYLLSNYGDIDFDGRQKLLNAAVNDFYTSSKTDTEVYSSIMRMASLENKETAKIIVNVTGKDHLRVNADIASNAAKAGDYVFTVLSSSQLKSADPVTYDYNGNVIPLSQRFNTKDEDIRYSRAPSLAATQEILKTGKLPDDSLNYSEKKDLMVTKFTDSTRPHDVWTRDLPDQGEAAVLIQAKNLASGRESAFNKEVMDNFGSRVSMAIGAIHKANKDIDFDAAQRLAGDWMSATYAPIANQNLLKKDMQALQEAVDAAKLESTPETKGAVTRAKNIVIKRQAAIVDKRVIDPTKQKLDIGLAGGYNDATAKQMTTYIEERIDKELLQSVADIVYEMNAWKLQKDIELGKVTKEMAAQFDQSGKYVPLTGDPRSDETASDVFGTGSTNQGKDRAMKGRTSGIAQNGIDASFEQIQKTARYHGWADYKDALHGMYERSIAKYLANGSTQQEAQKKTTEDLGISRSPETIQRPSDDVIIYRKNGKAWVYDLGNKAAIDALRSANVEPIPTAYRYAALATRAMARLVTQFMPGFAPVNALRDTWEKSENIRTRVAVNYPDMDMNKVARTMLGYSLKSLTTLHKSIMPVVAQGTPLEARLKLNANNADQKLMMEFLADGGASTWGQFLSTDGKDLAEKLGKMHSLPTKAVETLDVWNNSWELISSFSAYKALRENGMDSKAASNMALELMNFRKGGELMKPIKALYMFAQPIASGGHQLLKTLDTRRGKARFAAYAAAGFVLYGLLRSGEDDDELGINRMDNRPNYELERNIIIPYGDAGKGIAIPIGFGLPMLAWTYAVNTAKLTLGKQTSGETAIELIVKTPIKTFAPVAPSESSISKNPWAWLVQTVTPTIGKPIANVALDRTSFGGSLTSSRFEKPDKANALEGRLNTPEFYKDAAKELANVGLDTYPEVVREIIHGYFIGAANVAVKAAIDNPAKEARGKEPVSQFIDRWVKNQDRDDLKQRLYYRYREELNDVGVKASLGKTLDDKQTAMLKILEETKKDETSVRTSKAQATKKFGNGKNPAIYEAELKRGELKQSDIQVKLIKKMNELDAK